MGRLGASALLLCALIGFLLGGLIPMPWDERPPAPPASANNVLTAPGSASSGSGSGFAVDPYASSEAQSNFSLLNAAFTVVRALNDRDYPLLSTLVHPQKGVTFTPYSTVNFETDLNFSRDALQKMADDHTVYTWGALDGRDKLIELTFSQYMAQYVCNADYAQAPQIGIDRVILSGNALENIAQAYPDCRFVDFSYPYLDASGQGMDWCSLKLVFECGPSSSWQLVGIVHGQWTA